MYKHSLVFDRLPICVEVYNVYINAPNKLYNVLTFGYGKFARRIFFVWELIVSSVCK